MTVQKLHRHVDLRIGSFERLQRRVRARRGPDARRALFVVLRRRS